MNNNLPVFLISGKSPVKNPGGYAAYAHNLAKVLTQLGHPVYIIAQGPEQSLEKTEIGEEHIVASNIANRLPFLKSVELAALPLFAPIFAKEIEKIIKEQKFKDFVVWGMGPWSYAGVLLKKKFGKQARFIAFYPTTFLHEMTGSYDAIKISDYGVGMKVKYFFVANVIARLYGILEAQTVKLSDIITLNYKYPESFLEKQFLLNPKKFRQMSYYVEVFGRKAPGEVSEEEFKGLFENNKTLIIVCRQDPRKGINFLLHAFKKVRRKVGNIKLLVVGSGTMIEPNRKLAGKLGISKDVIFTGFVADFGPLLKRADIFVFPPTEEGSGSLSVLEAMKFGKPIIASDCDGIPEDVTDGKNGLIVPKMDIEALAGAIVKLINNPKLARQLGRSAKEDYEKKYSLGFMKRDVKRILRQL